MTTTKDALPTVLGEVRFQFGANWKRFLATVNGERVDQARSSLETMLEAKSLSDKTFLDVGCGSGLFSLAAMRLGAKKVHSFDYDPVSVECAQELKRRYYPQDDRWSIERGSALDRPFLSRLGAFEVVYAWGVLHHTGRLCEAMQNMVPLVTDSGLLCIAIYNDQGFRSAVWRQIKRLYSRSSVAAFMIRLTFIPCYVGGALLKDLSAARNPLARFRRLPRGMSIWHDWLDWLGGYPFEVAKPDEVIRKYRSNGYELVSLKTCGSRSGCNEFVFLRKPTRRSGPE